MSCIYELQSIIVRNRGKILDECKYKYIDTLYMWLELIWNFDFNILFFYNRGFKSSRSSWFVHWRSVGCCHGNSYVDILQETSQGTCICVKKNNIHWMLNHYILWDFYNNWFTKDDFIGTKWDRLLLCHWFANLHMMCMF